MLVYLETEAFTAISTNAKSYLWNSMQKDTNIAFWYVLNWTKCHHYNYRLK